MKKIFLIAALLCILSFVPSGAFALVDAAAYGGYSFLGNIEIGDEKYNGVKGYQFGVFAHLNVNTDLFLLGLGFATQGGDFSYEIHGVDQEFQIRTSWGPDVIFMLNVSSTSRPYARIGFSIVDSLRYDYGAEHKVKNRYFNSGWWALGVGVKVASLVVIFAEFQRCTTQMNEEHELVRNMVNAGVMVVY